MQIVQHMIIINPSWTWLDDQTAPLPLIHSCILFLNWKKHGGRSKNVKFLENNPWKLVSKWILECSSIYLYYIVLIIVNKVWQIQEAVNLVNI